MAAFGAGAYFQVRPNSGDRTPMRMWTARLGRSQMTLHSTLGLAIPALMGTCVLVGIFSEAIVVWRIKFLDKKGKIEANKFIYSFWNRAKIDIFYGKSRKEIGDRTISVLIYIYRAAIAIFVLIWCILFSSAVLIPATLKYLS
jgi:hypothetical protein